jgi:hypothetical protein
MTDKDEDGFSNIPYIEECKRYGASTTQKVIKLPDIVSKEIIDGKISNKGEVKYKEEDDKIVVKYEFEKY